ncbi:hypothetical protein CMI44_02075 [Candidatus Pacearchaeota archaeon]|nr:hypothetical protein [Candidatus Pacearchaeota archaeon]|tara:strand:- start:343 stop:789 length:447 start_codon:yes stop_codon:yes gene_type:complete
MDFKIISDIENPLFNRREIEGEIYAEVVPSREEVKKIMTEKFSANPDAVKIRTIKGKFGQKVFLIVANIYRSKEDLDKVELKKKKDIKIEKPAESVAKGTEEPVSVEESKPEEKLVEPETQEDESLTAEKNPEPQNKGKNEGENKINN